MSETAAAKGNGRRVIVDLSGFPLWMGFACLFIPTLYSLFTDIWSMEEQAHGPIILALALWLLNAQWSDMLVQTATIKPGATARWLGWCLFFVGLVCYIVGRSVSIIPLEMSSFIILVAAVLIIQHSFEALKLLWFPLFFMLFMIPLPGPLVTMLTLPMKLAVSFVTENILYALDYPITRSGVILQIGQYQLMVADACAGLQTLLTLEALGLFYMNLVRFPSKFRNIALALLIIPISFTANVIRVMTLTLVTYYMGDDAGQGFLHGFAGMVLFASALALILALDNFLRWVVKVREAKATERVS